MKMELKNWINVEKLDWTYLSKNPNAIDLLEANPDKINWRYLSSNPEAIHILKTRRNKKKLIGEFCQKIKMRFNCWKQTLTIYFGIIYLQIQKRFIFWKTDQTKEKQYGVVCP